MRHNPASVLEAADFADVFIGGKVEGLDEGLTQLTLLRRLKAEGYLRVGLAVFPSLEDLHHVFNNVLGFTRLAVEVEYLTDVGTHSESKHTHTRVSLEETIRRFGKVDELLGQIEGVRLVGVFNLVLNELAYLIQRVFRIDIGLPGEVFVYAVLKEIRHVHSRTFTVVTDVRLGVE